MNFCHVYLLLNLRGEKYKIINKTKSYVSINGEHEFYPQE